MKKGFTLAEVLITLTIVGVVAALTIPTLLANTGSRKFATQYKKVVSTLKQAILLGNAHYDVTLSDLNATCKNGASDTIEDRTICGLFNTTLAGATFVPNAELSDYTVTYEDGTTGSIGVEGTIGYILADGSFFVFDQKEGTCTAEDPCYVLIDANGKTLPNKEVTGLYISYDNLLMPAAYADDMQKEKNPTAKYSVPADKEHMTDIYPVYMYDQHVVPATDAAQYVLTGVGPQTQEDGCGPNCTMSNKGCICPLDPGIELPEKPILKPIQKPIEQKK